MTLVAAARNRTNPVPSTAPGVPERFREFAPRSATVIGVYVFLILALLYEGLHGVFGTFPFVGELLVAVLLIYLARYISTAYTIDGERLRAARLFGSRSVPLVEVSKIEIGNLRDLGPVSLFHGWGWRGRMWSPVAGKFDAVHTVSAGLLISADGVPLFVSPRDPLAFGRELSRRVRSVGGVLVTDDSRAKPEPAAP